MSDTTVEEPLTQQEMDAAIYGHLEDDPWPEDFDPAEAARVAGWVEFRDAGGADLLAVDTTRPIEWVPGAEQIIRQRERQSWIASQGEGKTQAALHLAVQVCEAGGRVIYVDVENDAVEMAGRLQSIVASYGEDAREAVKDRFAYLPDLNLAETHKTEDTVGAWIRALLATDLLIIDSLSRVLTVCGFEEDSNSDIAEFMTRYIDPIAKHAGGVAILILDNTGHEGKRARGAINKAALVEAVYRVSGGKDVTPSERGTLTLTRSRSRSGQIAKKVTASAGGGEYGRLAPQATPEQAEAESGAKVKRRQAIAKLLTDSPTEDFTIAEIEKVIPASKNTLKADVEALVADGLAQRTRTSERAIRVRARLVGQSGGYL